MPKALRKHTLKPLQRQSGGAPDQAQDLEFIHYARSAAMSRLGPLRYVPFEI